MTTNRRILMILGVAGLAFASTPFLDPAANAAPPASVRVPGSLSDRSGGGAPVPANGTFSMQFSLYDALTGGASVASAGPIGVPVQLGLYNTDVPFPASAFGGTALFLEVAINGEVLAPRIPIVSVPYAYQAGQATAVVPGAIVTASIAPGAVTTDKLGIPCADGQILIHSGNSWICGTPPTQAVCNGNDYINCYDGPENTIGVGLCHFGRRACTAGGTYGPCTAQVLPSTESNHCDGLDNNCDGEVDNACAVCGNGVVEPTETCDDGGTTPSDGCSDRCLTEPGYVCTGQPSVCAFQCGPGFSNCDGNAANGCECASTSCCGLTCGSVHSNGLGQSYGDCVPLGTPGSPSTYTLAMATSARGVWTGTGSDFNLVDYCGTNLTAVLRQTANSCAVWVYTGSLAGYVRLNTANASCLCPSTNAPTWN
jgi:cysteine-rich repeat protein